jgi:amino acid transporter
MPQAAAPKSLTHRLSASHVFLLTMSTLSPALSVFVYGGEILKSVGAAIAFPVGILVAVVWGGLYGELGSAFPHAGGEYAGITGTLGASAGFIDIAMLAVVYPVTNALTAVGFTTYLRFLWPGIPVQSTVAVAVAIAGP